MIRIAQRNRISRTTAVIFFRELGKPPSSMGLIMPRQFETSCLGRKSVAGGLMGSAVQKWALHWVMLPVLCGLLQTLAFGQSAAVGPARILTQYALTATQDTPDFDPKSWRLLGSNDGGKSWTLLDVRTNQFFITRSQRRTFLVRNRVGFNTYRLQIDEIDGAGGLGRDMSVQLAEVEFLGPLVGTDKESDVQEIITSSRAHPLLGPAENAFDHDPMTRWRDYGFGTPTGCWIQCQYTYHSEREITNIHGVQEFVCLAASADALADKGPEILSNLAAHAAAPLPVVTGYALTSANDEPRRDPQAWRLLGSNDGGATWQQLDDRSEEIFDERFQRRVFALTNTAVYAAYRLEIRALRAPGSRLQLGKLEPLYSQKTAADAFSIVVSANSDNPPIESCEKALDGDPKNKWLSISATDVSESQPGWLQWQYVPREEELPVIGLHALEKIENRLRFTRMLSRTNQMMRSIHGYALVSGDDFPERDPRDWRLLGSKDGGRHWEVLDVRQQETFGARRQRRVFSLPREVAYPKYRLQIDSVASPGLANSVQLAEIEPLGPSEKSDTDVCVVVAAQGENGPLESADQAFDRKPETKWLDFAEGRSNRASWIEWRYVRNVGVPVLNADEMSAHEQSRTAQLRLSLTGTVVYSDPEIKAIGILDQTGFQVFETPGCASVHVGDRAHLRGNLSCRHGVPFVSDLQYVRLGSLAAAGNSQAEEPANPNKAAGLTAVEGVVTSISYDDSYSTLSLSRPDHYDEQIVRVVGARLRPPMSLLNCRIRVRGILEGLCELEGRSLTSLVWASGLEAISLAVENDQAWTAWRNCPLQDLTRENPSDCAIVRVHGIVTGHAGRDRLLLGNGTNRLEVRCLGAASWRDGADVEAAGLLMNRPGQMALFSALVHANASPAATTEPTREAPNKAESVVGIGAVRETSRTQPERGFPFRIQGVITYIDLALGEFYLQNGADGVCLQGQLNAGLSPFQHQEGNCVEIEGTASNGQLHATSFVRVLGRAGMPAPVRHSWNYLMLGNDDGRWIELEGIISAVERQRLTLTVGGKNIAVWINELNKNARGSLLGTMASVAGVCSPVVNGRNQRVGFRLLVPSGEYVHVINAVPANPLEQPTTPIGEVLQVAPSGWTQPAQVIKTKGVVTYCEPNLIFIQDATAGLRVGSRRSYDIAPGDLVEVSGRAEPDGFSIKLIQAVIRKIGHGEMPRALPINLRESKASGQEEALDATRVQLTATVLAQHFDGPVQTLILQHEQTRQAFSAFIPAGAEPPAVILPGSRVELQGVFKAKRETVDIDQAISAFELYVASSRDVRILNHPSWWTTRHTVWSLTGLGVVLLVSLCWVYLLRHQVRQRTLELNQQIEKRQLLEHRRVVEQERMRVAQDLHDELGAGLTEVGLLGDLVKNPQVPATEKQRYLDTLTDTSRSLVSSLDEIVWAVNPTYDSIASLASYCILFAQRFLKLAKMTCRTHIPQDIPEHPLDSITRHHLFLVVKEALNNTVRHSGATEVQLELSMTDGELVIAVIDNGRGFELHPEALPGKDGIPGMRRRMERLGGSCRHQSQPGKGTEVELKLPLKKPLS